MPDSAARGDNRGVTRTAKPISARVRILAAILAVACVGLAIVGSVTFLVQRERVIAEVNDRLMSQVDRLKTVAESGADGAADDVGDTTAREDLDISEYTSVEQYLKDAVARLVPARNEASVAIIDGKPALSFPRRCRASTSPATRSSSSESSTRPPTARRSGAPRSPNRDPSATSRSRSRWRATTGPASTSAPSTSAPSSKPVTAAMNTYIIAAIAVLGAIGIVGWFVTGRLLSPIRHMRDTASSITISDLSPRLPTEGNDDIADLSRTMNSMLDRLEGSVDVQRQLLDDVRHELKTPITIVRGHLELMDPSDAADVESARQIGIAELDRMTRLVEDIDLLATVEGDSYTMTDVDLGALTSRVGELVAVIPDHSWSVEAARRGRHPGRSGPPAAGLAPARRQRRQVHARRRAHRDRQPPGRLRAPGCGSAITVPGSRPPRATASSVASTAPTASGRSAVRVSASRSSTRSPRATADCAS